MSAKSAPSKSVTYGLADWTLRLRQKAERLLAERRTPAATEPSKGDPPPMTPKQWDLFADQIRLVLDDYRTMGQKIFNEGTLNEIVHRIIDNGKLVERYGVAEIRKVAAKKAAKTRKGAFDR